MGLSDGRKGFPIGFAVLIQYRSVTASQPPSHVAVTITLNAKASSLKMEKMQSYLKAWAQEAFARGPHGSGGPVLTYAVTCCQSVMGNQLIRK